MLLDIVILPPQKLRQRIGKRIRAAVKGFPTIFVVDNKKLIPHMSLFHINTSAASRLRKIEGIVAEIAKKHRPLRILSRKFEIIGKYGGYELSNSSRLKKLNREVVLGCYALRTGVMPWTSEKKPTALELRNRQKYGTQHNIGKAFRPHFTMFALKDEKFTRQIAKKMNRIKFSFTGDTIAICEVNFWHQVTKIIKSYKIK